MVQILPNKMVAIRKALKEMKNIDIVCGPADGHAAQTEAVSLRWIADDTEFNMGLVWMSINVCAANNFPFFLPFRSRPKCCLTDRQQIDGRYTEYPGAPRHGVHQFRSHFALDRGVHHTGISLYPCVCVCVSN